MTPQQKAFLRFICLEASVRHANQMEKHVLASERPTSLEAKFEVKLMIENLLRRCL